MTINDSSSDYNVVERLQEGDLEAFDTIFEKYGSRLFAFAFNYLKSKEDAEGLVQDIFLKIWENRKSIKKESSLKSYLFTIAYHEMCRIFRKKQIHQKFLQERSLTANATASLDEQLEYKAALEQIDELIEQLPDKRRIIFEKSRKQGKTTKEIAAEMNLKPGTVDNNISAALKFIREKLSNKNFALMLLLTIFI